MLSNPTIPAFAYGASDRRPGLLDLSRVRGMVGSPFVGYVSHTATGHPRWQLRSSELLTLQTAAIPVAVIPFVDRKVTAARYGTQIPRLSLLLPHRKVQPLRAVSLSIGHTPMTTTGEPSFLYALNPTATGGGTPTHRILVYGSQNELGSRVVMSYPTAHLYHRMLTMVALTVNVNNKNTPPNASIVGKSRKTHTIYAS